VFLDEIGDLPPDIQPKLLRFLETAEVHPLGEPEPVKVEVRVIAATNADLDAHVAQGRFRTDLYYRLNVVPLTVPPLRDRREEVPALANLYLRRYADEFDRGVLTFAPETLEMLVTYKWPGNVRQLANEIRRVAALARSDAAITPAMLSRDIVKTTAASLPSRPVAAAEPAKLPISLDQALGEAVASLEAAMIRRALAKAGGHVDDAAAMLGLSRKGLFLKRRRLGIGAPES
jgi:DNA-binding NtrC family response regulator